MEKLTKKLDINDQMKAKQIISEANRISPYKTIREHQYGVSCLALNSNNNDLISGSFDNTLLEIVYDTVTYSTKNKLEKHKDGVWCCDFNEKKGLISSGGSDSKIIIWSTDYKYQSEIDFHKETIYDVKFCKENENLLASCSKQKIAIWDIRNTSKNLNLISCDIGNFVYSLNFLHGDQYLVYGFFDGELVIHDLKSNKPISNTRINYAEYRSENNLDYNNSIYSLNLTSESSFLCSLSDGTVREFDFDKNKLSEIKCWYYNWMPMTEAIQKGKKILATSKDQYSFIWDSESTEKVDSILFGHTDIVTCGKWITNEVVATSSYDQTVRFWKV